MKNFYRTDLGCEKSASEKTKYHIFSREIDGITAVFSVLRETGKTENILMYTGKPYKYSREYCSSVIGAVSDSISLLLGDKIKKYRSVLVCGLGNRLVTSDSLGPAVTDKLYPTVALEEYDTKIFLLSPGAEGQNGFSTFDNVKSAVELSECELLIVIDSLCARSPERLSATIQLSSTGILPGSGVGNHKKEISKETLSVPVISIGVPTVSELKVLSEGEDIFFLSPSDIDLCISSFADILASSIEKIFYRKRT